MCLLVPVVVSKVSCTRWTAWGVIIFWLHCITLCGGCPSRVVVIKGGVTKYWFYKYKFGPSLACGDIYHQHYLVISVHYHYHKPAQHRLVMIQVRVLLVVEAEMHNADVENQDRPVEDTKV